MWCFIDKNYFFIACSILLLLCNLHDHVTCSSSEELVFKSLGHGDSDSKSSVVESVKRVKKQINLNNQVPNSINNLNATDGNESDAETLVGIGVGIKAQEQEITQKQTHTLTETPLLLNLDHSNDTSTSNSGSTSTSNTNTNTSTSSSPKYPSSTTLSIAPSRVNGKPTMTVTATRIGMTRYFSSDPNPNPNQNSNPNANTKTKTDTQNTGIDNNNNTDNTASATSTSSHQQHYVIINSSPSPAPFLLGEKLDNMTNILGHSVATTTVTPLESLTNSPDENENVDDYVDEEHDHDDEDVHKEMGDTRFFNQEDSSEENLIVDLGLKPLNSISNSGAPQENIKNNNNIEMTMSVSNPSTTPASITITPETMTTTAVDSLDIPRENRNRAGNEMTGMSLNIQKDGNSFDASGKEEGKDEDEDEGEEDEHEEEQDEEVEREKVAEMEIEMNDWDLYKPVDLNALHTLSSPKINPNRMSMKDRDNKIARAEELPDPVPLVSSSSSSSDPHNNNYNSNSKNDNHHQIDGPREEDFAEAFSRNNAGHMPKTRRRRLRTNSNAHLNNANANSNNNNNNNNNNSNGNNVNPHPAFIRRRVRKMRGRKLNDTFSYNSDFFPGGNPEDEILRHFHNQQFSSQPVGEASEINSFNIHTSSTTTENPSTNPDANTNINTNETSKNADDSKKLTYSKLRENLAKLSHERPRMRRFRSTTPLTPTTTSTTPMTPIIDTDFKTPAFISDFTITEVPPPSFTLFPEYNNENQHQRLPESESEPKPKPKPSSPIQPILLKSPKRTEIIPYGVDKEGNTEYIITATENPEPQIERPNIGYTEKSNIDESESESFSTNLIPSDRNTETSTAASILQRKRKKVKGKGKVDSLRPVFVPSTPIITPVLSKSAPSTVHNNETGEWLHSDHSKHHDMIPHHYVRHHKMNLNNNNEVHININGPPNSNLHEIHHPPDGFLNQERDSWEKNYMNLQQHSFASAEAGPAGPSGSGSGSGPLQIQIPVPMSGDDSEQDMEVIVHTEPTVTSVVEHHYDAMGVPMSAPPPPMSNQDEDIEISLLQQPQPQSQSGPFYSGSGSHSNKLTIGGRPKLVFGNEGEREREEDEEETGQMIPFISASISGPGPGSGIQLTASSSSSLGGNSNGGRGSSASSSQSYNPYHTSAESPSPFHPLPLPHFDTPIIEEDEENPFQSNNNKDIPSQSHSQSHPPSHSSHYDRTKQKYIMHPNTQAALKPVLSDMDRGKYIRKKQKKQQQYSNNNNNNNKYVRPRQRPPPPPPPSSSQSVNHESLPTPLKLTSNENLNGIQSPIEDHFQSMRNLFFNSGQNLNHNHNQDHNHGGFPSPFKMIDPPQSFQHFTTSTGIGQGQGQGQPGSESERIPKYLNNHNQNTGPSGPSGPSNSGPEEHTTIIHHHHYDDYTGEQQQQSHDNNGNNNGPPPPPPLTLPMPGLVHIPTPPSEAQGMNEVTSHRHFPPHSHSMSVQSEYEPANPPLPSGQHHLDQHFDPFVQNAGNFKESSSDFSSHPQQPPPPQPPSSGNRQKKRPNGKKNYPQNYNNNNNNDQSYNDIIILGNNNNGNSHGNDFQGNHRQPPPVPPQFQNQNPQSPPSSIYPGVSNNEITPGSEYNEAISPGEPFDFGENPSAAPLTYDKGHSEEHKGNDNHVEKPEDEEDEEEVEEVISPYSETPYVIMFPNVAPPKKSQHHHASPSSNLPALAALGMGGGIASVLQSPHNIPGPGHSLDMPFASASGAAPEKLLGPGMKVVPVHPRIQMLKALANKEYQNKLEQLQAQANKPPSAIYTPYGVLIPMRQSQAHSQYSDSKSGGSSSHNSFIPPPPPTITKKKKKPKNLMTSDSQKSHAFAHHNHHLKDEQSVLNILLGSKIPPLGHINLKSRMKMKNLAGKDGLKASLEPAMDLLAEKLAVKLSALEYLITHPPKTLGLHKSNKIGPHSAKNQAPAPASVYNSHSQYEPASYHQHQETSYSELKPVKASIGQGQEQEQDGNKKNKSSSSKTSASATGKGKGNRNDKEKKPFPSSPASVHTVNKLKVNAPLQNQHLQHSNFETGAGSRAEAGAETGRKQAESSSSSSTVSSSSSPSPLFSNYLKSLLKDRLFEMLEESYQHGEGEGEAEERKNGTSKKSSGTKKAKSRSSSISTKTTTPLPIPSHPFATQPRSKSPSQTQVRRKENFPSFFGPAPAPALGSGFGSKIQFGPFTFPNLRRQNKKNLNQNQNPNPNVNGNGNPHLNLNPNVKKNRQLNNNQHNVNINPNDPNPNPSQGKQHQQQQQQQQMSHQTQGGILNTIKRLFSFGNGQNGHQNHNNRNSSQILRGKNPRGGNGNGNGMMNRIPPRNKNPHQNPNQNPNQNQQQKQHQNQNQPQHQHFEHNLVKDVSSPFIKSTREIEKMLRLILKNSPFHHQLDDLSSSSVEKTRNPNSQQQQQQQNQYYHSHYTKLQQQQNQNQKKQGMHYTNPHPHPKAMFQSSHPKWLHGTNGQSISSSFSHNAPVAMKVIPAPQLSPSAFHPLEMSRSNSNGIQQNVMSKRMDEEIFDSSPMSSSPLASLYNNYPFNLLPTLTSWKPMPTFSTSSNGNGNNTNSKPESNFDSASDSESDSDVDLDSDSSLKHVIKDFIPLPNSSSPSSSKEAEDGQNDVESPNIVNTPSSTDSISNNSNSSKTTLLVDKSIPEQATSTSTSTSVLHKIQPRSV